MSQHFSLAACDVVGFDLDHTLCRYNLPESARVSGAGSPRRTASTAAARLRSPGAGRKCACRGPAEPERKPGAKDSARQSWGTG